MGRARAVGDHSQGYTVASEPPEGFDRAGEQRGPLFALLPVGPGDVTGKAGEIEAQLAQGLQNYASTGSYEVRAAYALALRVGPVPLARPEYLIVQVIGVEFGDAGRRVGAYEAPTGVAAAAVVDDGVVEVDEHRAGRGHGAILWGHRPLPTNRADRSGE